MKRVADQRDTLYARLGDGDKNKGERRRVSSRGKELGRLLLRQRQESGRRWAGTRPKNENRWGEIHLHHSGCGLPWTLLGS